jgi:hypothetical protein
MVKGRKTVFAGPHNRNKCFFSSQTRNAKISGIEILPENS